MDATRNQPAGEGRKIYTVSEINALARDLLESSFFDVWIKGEVSNLRSPGSGHLYFTLKDASSQIAAVLFRSQAALLRFRLEDGLQVLAVIHRVFDIDGCVGHGTFDNCFDVVEFHFSLDSRLRGNDKRYKITK